MIQVQFADGAAYRGETGVYAAAPGVNHHYIVGTTQVIAERLGARISPVVVGARQQVVKQFTAKSQLQFGKVALMGELEPQHVAAKPQGEQLVIIEFTVGVDERENTEYLRVRLDQNGYPVPRTHRLGLRGKQAQKMVGLTGLGLRIPDWPSGPRPCSKVAEPVYDPNRPAGQSMKCIHEAWGTVTGGERRPH